MRQLIVIFATSFVSVTSHSNIKSYNKNFVCIKDDIVLVSFTKNEYHRTQMAS